MRNITKTITLPAGENTFDFRLTKLDAFSGARLLKLLIRASTDNLQELLLSLPDADLEYKLVSLKVMKKDEAQFLKSMEELK